MPSGEGNENSQNKSVALISQKKTMHVIIIIIMTLFNEGNTKQPKANKLMALKTQSYKYIISILIKTLKNYLQCLGIKRLQNRCKKKKSPHYCLPACRRLLFPLLHAEKGLFLFFFSFPRATKEIGDVCTQATLLLEYIFAKSALLYALLFVITNIYSVYSIYPGVGHVNFIQRYMLYK